MKSMSIKAFVFMFIFNICSFLSIKNVWADTVGDKKVLILNSYDQGLQWTRDIVKGIEEELIEKENIEIHYEFMDMKNNPQYFSKLYSVYKEKYKNFKFDVIICSDNDALNFAVKYGNGVFGGSPVVFCGINEFHESMLKNKKNFTGVIEKINIKDTINNIMYFQPGTKKIAIVTDSTTTGKINEKIARSEIGGFKNKYRFYFYRDITPKQLYDNVKNLGENTVVLNIAQLRKETGELIPFQKMKNHIPNLNIPIYVCWDFLLQKDVIGGSVIKGYSQGKTAAKLALRILEGESASNIPIIKECPSENVFNYNQLIKYKIDLNKVTDKYTIINKPFSFYETYKKIIFATFFIIVILSIFTIVLAFNIRKTAQSEKKLFENYAELTTVYQELTAKEEELRSQYKELEQIEEKNRVLAYYDQLTSLPNRVYFIEELKKELEKVKHTNNKGAILFIDTDNFKNVNDTLGHHIGDELLKLVGARISSCMKDRENVFRIGGDEFLIIQRDVKEISCTKNLADKIVKLFEKPFNINGRSIFTTASIGISMFPEDGTEENLILKNADTAMYKAKEEGKNKYLFYDEKMFKEIARKSELEKELREAIDKNELQLYFQPQISAIDMEFKGAEVLLRWKNDKFGFVSPAEFIPLAEETLLIIPIGKWILKEACLKTKAWIDRGRKPLTVCVNVSIIQLNQEDFLQSVKEILNETKLPPEYLEIEITESVLIKNLKVNLQILKEIKRLGIKIALDDFGTGYSSLSYLRILPIDKLKLDKSFIDKIDVDNNDQSILDGIVQLAHKLELNVIAEGVETEGQFNVLKKIKCDQIQGYYFSKPIPENEFEIKYVLE